MAIIDNIKAYYKLDSDGSIPDSTGDYDGTNSGATYTASGKINGAYSFDGANNYVTIPTINMGNNFSYNFWIKPTSWTDSHPEYIFVQGTGTNRIDAGHYVVSSNNVEFGINNGTWHYVQDTDNPSGSWIMYTLTYDNSNLRLYKNGSLIDTEAVAGFSLNYALVMGHSGSAFLGDMDEFGMWNKVLSQAEITSLYNSGNGLSYPFTTGLNLKLNIGDTWKAGASAKINIGDSWKTVASIKQNIGDTWKTV